MVNHKFSKIYDNFALKLLSQQEISRYDRAVVVGYYGDIIIGSFIFLSIAYNPEIIRSIITFLKFCSIFAFFFGMIEIGVEYFQAECFGLYYPKPLSILVHPSASKKGQRNSERFKLEFMNPKLSDGFQVLYDFN